MALLKISFSNLYFDLLKTTTQNLQLNGEVFGGERPCTVIKLNSSCLPTSCLPMARLIQSSEIMRTIFTIPSRRRMTHSHLKGR